MKLRFGIIGIGNISHRFMKGIRLVEDGEVVAIASRNQKKAQEYANAYQIPRYYGSYEELVADPEIDVIYIATPPSLHYEHVMLCLHHKKHVLCEKPFLTSKSEMEKVFALAQQQRCFVMEAQKSVFLPATKQVKDWITEGRIGKVQYVEASYCYQGDFPESHFIFDRGGGSMFDVGVYPLSYLDYVIDLPIHKLQIQTVINDNSRYDNPVDISAQLMLEYEGRILGYVRSSIGVKTNNKACVYGDKGWIGVDNFWKAQQCFLHSNEETTTMSFPTESEFCYQIQEAISCIKQGALESKIMSWQRSLNIMEILEQVQSTNQKNPRKL